MLAVWPLVETPSDLDHFRTQAMFGFPISAEPRLEMTLVRLPFPRKRTGSIYEAQQDIKNQAFARAQAKL